MNFEVLTQRNAMYRDKEKLALEEFLRNPQKDLALVRECRAEKHHVDDSLAVGASHGK